MEKAGNLLGRVARRIGHPQAPLAWLTGSWPQIVGKTVAAHTRLLHCHNGCLEVAADGKAWRCQLESMSRDFCAQINQAWGGTLVREVKFAASKSRPAAASAASASHAESRRRTTPYELDNDHLPFIRRRK